MAVIQEGSWGLVPHGQPKLYKTYAVGVGQTILRYQPVHIAANTIFPSVANSDGVSGVAMSHGAAGEDVIVCIDPDAIYEATGDAAVTQAMVGHFTDLISNTVTGPTSEVSGVLVDIGNTPATTPATGDNWQVVGLPTTVTQDTTDFKLLVRAVKSKFTAL